MKALFLEAASQFILPSHWPKFGLVIIPESNPWLTGCQVLTGFTLVLGSEPRPDSVTGAMETGKPEEL